MLITEDEGVWIINQDFEFLVSCLFFFNVMIVHLVASTSFLYLWVKRLKEDLLLILVWAEYRLQNLDDKSIPDVCFWFQVQLAVCLEKEREAS